MTEPLAQETQAYLNGLEKMAEKLLTIRSIYVSLAEKSNHTTFGDILHNPILGCKSYRPELSAAKKGRMIQDKAQISLALKTLMAKPDAPNCVWIENYHKEPIGWLASVTRNLLLAESLNLDIGQFKSSASISEEQMHALVTSVTDNEIAKLHKSTPEFAGTLERELRPLALAIANGYVEGIDPKEYLDIQVRTLQSYMERGSTHDAAAEINDESRSLRNALTRIASEAAMQLKQPAIGSSRAQTH